MTLYEIWMEKSSKILNPNPDIEKIGIANLEDLERIFLK